MGALEEKREGGWAFVFDESTGYVYGAHERGGRFDVCELSRRLVLQMDLRRQIGEAIAGALNGDD